MENFIFEILQFTDDIHRQARTPLARAALGECLLTGNVRPSLTLILLSKSRNRRSKKPLSLRQLPNLGRTCQSYQICLSTQRRHHHRLQRQPSRGYLKEQKN